MKIGVLSDTHGLLRAAVFPFLEGVEHILHAGDVGDPDILLALEAVAPVIAVRGNTDGFPLADRLPGSAELELGPARIALTHGHTLAALTPEALAAHFPTADLIVYGHTHRPREDRVSGQVVLNPGSCGPRRFGLPVTLAVVTLDETGIRAEIHSLPVD